MRNSEQKPLTFNQLSKDVQQQLVEKKKKEMLKNLSLDGIFKEFANFCENLNIHFDAQRVNYTINYSQGYTGYVSFEATLDGDDVYKFLNKVIYTSMLNNISKEILEYVGKLNIDLAMLHLYEANIITLECESYTNNYGSFIVDVHQETPINTDDNTGIKRDMYAIENYIKSVFEVLNLILTKAINKRIEQVTDEELAYDLLITDLERYNSDGTTYRIY